MIRTRFYDNTFTSLPVFISWKKVPVPFFAFFGMENRLRYLYHNKYLDRIILSDSLHSHKMIYVMTEKGARLLARTDDVARDEIPWRRHLNKISVTHIQHLLAINNAMISFEIALSKSQEKGKIKLFKVISTNPDNHKIAVILKNKDGARFESAIIPDAIVGVKFTNGEIGLFSRCLTPNHCAINMHYSYYMQSNVFTYPSCHI